MKKYKLINKKSCYKNGVLREGESCRFNNNCIYPNCCETICDKVTIDGFDYYVNDFISDEVNGDLTKIPFEKLMLIAVASNNPNIDIPQVVDEVERIVIELYPVELDDYDGKVKEYDINKPVRVAYTEGYNKSQETHPFSEEDMIEFLNWIRDNTVFDSAPKPYHRKTQTRLSQEELLQLWKEQRPKTMYYE